MIVLLEQDLKNYTTVHIGGIVKKMYFPENVEELREVLSYKDANQYIIGGGSNLLINNDRDYAAVICLKELDKRAIHHGRGEYYFGASVRLQDMIRQINRDGYGGIEYLYSVPGLLGGAIYMNAGRGNNYKQSIEDYVISVDCMVDGELKTYKKEDCVFFYRHSIFQELKNCVIIGGIFQFDNVDTQEGERRCRERIELCRKIQDNSYANFGSVFCRCNPYIMKIVKRYNKVFRKGNVGFSSSTNNWILNYGAGNFREAMQVIKRVKLIHKLFGKDCSLEVKIWN